MGTFSRHTLKNGLRVIAHSDTTTPLAVHNLLYDVGARDEDPEKTGFAHLFEHLMFEGSMHVRNFDGQIQMAGGESNAFTTNDITNYYINLPAVNIETAFWLESDRMLGLNLTEEKLIVQKKVVAEEYKQSYLNQPYGDTMLLFRPLCYEVHPYRWPTIGKQVDHIETATLNDVARFFSEHYLPQKAILSVSGPFKPDEIFRLAEKWYGDIPIGIAQPRNLPEEPCQTAERRLVVARDVPSDQIFIAFHCSARNHPDFFATDLLSDLLAHGDSSRLKERLVKEKKLFIEADAWLSGSLDPGLFVVTGKLRPGVAPEDAETALWRELEEVASQHVGNSELQKVKNKMEATHLFSESNLLARTMNLAYYELMGDADLVNKQNELYQSVSQQDIRNMALNLFQRKHASVMYYLSESP